MKRRLRIWMNMLLLALLTACLWALPAQADALSADKLSALMQRFPQGMYWDHLCEDPATTRSESYQNSVTSYACSHKEQTGCYDCNHFDGAGQCWGFARKLAYEYFGVLFSRQPTTTDLNQLKAGDIVRYCPGSSDHSIWVTGVDEDSVTYVDCNFDGPCRIGWNKTTTKTAISSHNFRFIEQAPSLINLDKTSLTLYGNQKGTLTATVVGPSQDVTWTSSNPLLIKVDEKGLTVKVGMDGSWNTLSETTATITAAANGVSATCTVTVKPGILQFTENTLTLKVGKEKVMAAEKIGMEGKIKYASSNPDVASIDSATGRLKARKAGSTVITAKLGGLTASCTVKVEASIRLDKVSLTLYKGVSASLKVKADGSVTGTKWKSSKSSVAKVKGSGKQITVTGKKVGKAVITATLNGEKATCEVTVKKTSIKLNQTSLTLEKGKTAVLKATVAGPGKKIKWKSSNPSVVTVNENGKVKAKKAGKATITATANGKTAKCTVTVKKVNYKALYKAFLENNRISAANYEISPNWYYVLNIDKKDMPELIVCSDGGAMAEYNIYTIRKGKVVYAGACATRGLSVDPPTISYNKLKKGIVTSGWTNFIGGAWANLFGMSGYKLKQTYHAREAHNPADEYYLGKTDTSAKKVSKSTYEKTCNKYFSGKVLTSYKMLRNTEMNRKKTFG